MSDPQLQFVSTRYSFSAKPALRNVAISLLAILFLLRFPDALANQPEVLFVELEQRGGVWTAHVKVQHADTGWEHYADAWRLLDIEGKVLGTRTLYHPHENEQPFTRSLSGVKIPPSLSVIDVQAHDKVHGWGAKVRVNLKRGKGERYRLR